MSVIDIKTVISADPEKSFVILHDTNDGTVGKSVDTVNLSQIVCMGRQTRETGKDYHDIDYGVLHTFYFFSKVMIAVVKTYGKFLDYMPVFAKYVLNTAFFNSNHVCLVTVNCIFGQGIHCCLKKQPRQNALLLGRNGNIVQDFNHHICIQTRVLLSLLSGLLKSIC